MEQSELILVKKIKGKGRGVFAKRSIKKGEIIERAPVVVVPISSLVNGVECPVLSKYFYLWGKSSVAISLGYGSLYNHSYKPNANYEHGAATLTYRAIKPIRAGDEITVNYNGDPKDRSSVGFEVV